MVQSSPVPIIPWPIEIKQGDPTKSVELQGSWKIRSNCGSDRLKRHLTSYFGEMFHQLTWEWPNSPPQIQRYPYGYLQPHDPFFIQLIPENLKLDEKIILKGIKWQIPWEARDYRATDEYDLVITRAIQISSRSERGLFYGLQTLKDIIEFTQNKLPFQFIHDYPSLSLRSIHLDLKQQRPTMQFLEEQIRDLAHYKINSLLIEWEDKFPFTEDLAILNHPNAFTVEEKDHLLDLCWLYYFDVIPLIQSLGHFSYVLKHTQFASLLEMKPEKSREVMFCPSKSQSRTLILKIHNQVLAGMGKHQECEFIHVGMDETYDLGSCPDCKNKIQNLGDAGKSKLYMDHLGWITQFYLLKGKRPIIWHDMLVRYPQHLSELDSRVILCDWEYEMPLPKVFPQEANIDPTGETIDWVRTWSQMTLEQMNSKKPATYDYFYTKYWKSSNGKYPFKAFPYTSFFKEQGYTVITAPAVQFGSLTPICPRYSYSIPNITYFNAHAIRAGVMGSICTNWVVRHSPWPMLQFGFILHAITTWNPKSVVDYTSNLSFWKNYFGLVEIENMGCDINLIAEFFPNLGKLGGNPERLYQILMKNQDDLPNNISIEQIKLILTQKISLYLQIFSKLEPKVKYHRSTFQYLLRMTELTGLFGKIFSVCIEIENVAIALDEGRSALFLSQDQMANLASHLKDYIQELSLIRKAYTALEQLFLSPIEFEIRFHDLFGFVDEISEPYYRYFSTFNNAKTSFTEFIIQSSLKRINF